jgi:Ca2+-binding RTX toxin-like protein
LITFRALGTAPDSPWRITVNGQTRFEGIIEPGTDVRANGGTGNDLVRVLAGAGNNQIQIGINQIHIANFWITSNQIEARNIRGQAGADTFIVRSESLSDTSLEGGGGPDTVQVDNVVGEWSITDRGSGTVNGAQFSSIRNLVGSGEADTFNLARNAEIIGTIDGRGGVNQIVYAANSRRVETTITSFATLSGFSSRLGGFSNIDNISVLNTQNNLLTYTADNFVNEYDLVLWNLNESSLSIEIRNYFNTIEAQYPDFFYASGYTNLRGTTPPDQFFFQTTVQSPVYNLEGGDTTTSNNFVNFPTGPVVVNFQNSTATGVSRFSNIIQFALETPGDSGTAIGPNTDTQWEIFADGFFLSDGRSATNFNNFQGGTGNDVFRFYDTNGAPNAPIVNGGGGRNTLDFSPLSEGVYVDLSVGVAPVTTVVSGFSDVIGSAYDDILLGNSLNNRLYGLSGNDTLRGEDGDDVLFGGAGIDQLFGGSGRDWLLGGSGADSLVGGFGDDLLIGDLGIGFENEADLSYAGLNHAAINAIFAEWTSTRSYLQRIQRLQNGVGPRNTVRLSSTTLASDSEIDSILGNEGNDWFWAELQDLMPDRNNAERVNRL